MSVLCAIFCCVFCLQSTSTVYPSLRAVVRSIHRSIDIVVVVCKIWYIRYVGSGRSLDHRHSFPRSEREVDFMFVDCPHVCEYVLNILTTMTFSLRRDFEGYVNNIGININ